MSTGKWFSQGREQQCSHCTGMFNAHANTVFVSGLCLTAQLQRGYQVTHGVLCVSLAKWVSLGEGADSCSFRGCRGLASQRG